MIVRGKLSLSRGNCSIANNLTLNFADTVLRRNRATAERRTAFFSISLGAVRPSQLGTSATNWPSVPAPDDKWVWSSRWNENWQGKPKYSEETCPNATLSTTNPIRTGLGSKHSRYGGKPATNSLSYTTTRETQSVGVLTIAWQSLLILATATKN
jgi:hypothetical protein